jgi:hypothetical protein
MASWAAPRRSDKEKRRIVRKAAAPRGSFIGLNAE